MCWLPMRGAVPDRLSFLGDYRVGRSRVAPRGASIRKQIVRNVQRQDELKEDDRVEAAAGAQPVEDGIWEEEVSDER